MRVQVDHACEMRASTFLSNNLLNCPVQTFHMNGHLTFVDLAGSKQATNTNEATGRTRLERANINASLLSRKNVIRALTAKI